MACDYFQRKKKAVQIDRAANHKAEASVDNVSGLDDRALLQKLLEQEKRILSGGKSYPHSLPRR